MTSRGHESGAWKPRYPRTGSRTPLVSTPTPNYDPMIPYTLVLKPGLVIYSLYNGYWFWGRPSFEDLRRDLREVTRAQLCS
jgi:hypothetical protein